MFRITLALLITTLFSTACRPASSPVDLAPMQVEQTADHGLQTPTPHTGISVHWNGVARDLVAQHRTGAGPAMRVFALLSLAQYQAVVGAEDTRKGARRPSVTAAVTAASTEVLEYLYPGSMAGLQRAAAEYSHGSNGSGGGDRDIESGTEIGRSVAAEVINRARQDRFFEPFTGTVPVCEGCWLPMPTPPAGATLGQARTFFVDSGRQFQPPPPPAFASPEFLAALAEVRSIADTRTPQQDSIARFWAMEGGTTTPLGYWNAVAADLISQKGMSERWVALTLAVMNMAAYDALVSSHSAKYTHWLIRPTQADPGITLSMGLPSFPSYPSNHAAISAAAATVLGTVFPAHRQALNRAAEEAAMSRVYGGIHFRFDSDAGLELGRSIARYALQKTASRYGPLSR